MMKLELREEDPSVNMVLRSGINTGGDVLKQTREDGKGRDALTREPDFEME